MTPSQQQIIALIASHVAQFNRINIVGVHCGGTNGDMFIQFVFSST